MKIEFTKFCKRHSQSAMDNTLVILGTDPIYILLLANVAGYLNGDLYVRKLRN